MLYVHVWGMHAMLAKYSFSAQTGQNEPFMTYGTCLLLSNIQQLAMQAS